MKNELEYQKLKGLFVFCNKCKTDIHHNKKGNKCNHPIEKQVYKAIIRIPGSGYERKTKILKSRDFSEAVKEFLDFKEMVQNPLLQQEADKKTKTPFLKDAIVMYIDYMNDVDVPFHLKKYLSESHIYSTTIALKIFVRFIVSRGIKFETFKLSQINDSIVGYYCDFLNEKYDNNYTFNDKIRTLRIFFNYLIEKEEYSIKNVWKKVKLKSEKPTDITISDKDFFDLLKIISPDESFEQIGKSRRNMYRPWLKDLIRLKAYTGRRNAELFAMKWNMIHFEDGMPVYIESPNIKVNKKQNNFEEKDFQYTYIPVGEELFELLIDLKLEQNVNSDNYIIAPETKNRQNIEKYSSKYFTFFFKRLKRNYIRQLKHLRQTYITKEDTFINRGISMQHSSYNTTSKHYIDRKEIAKQMVESGFRIFPKKEKGTPEGHSSHKKRTHNDVSP